MKREHALKLLRQMIGEDKNFRPGQWEAIEAIVYKKQRVLVVQRTGWGKSLVYFLATRLLRDEGYGLTLLISPLLSLMRNQIEAAKKIGIHARTIHSANRQEWKDIEAALTDNECDLILISPERLNNDYFLENILPLISGSIGLFVVDEAHCISDWGHDFRPDYRRILRILQMLPANIPVLGTTATANDRVIEDVQTQLGQALKVIRGPLARESLRLQNIRLHHQSERLAWLAENLLKFKGSGIIYCLTVADTERVAAWLKLKGFSAEAYHAGINENTDRLALEQAFLKNEVKILVATVALGMGFDKPDVEFVIHFQCPGSVIAYYQQVGRAGRELDRSYGILLSGDEDDDIQNYFIDTAFPDAGVFKRILRTVEKSDGVTINFILSEVNTSRAIAEKALKLLELDGAIGQTHDRKKLYFRTPNRWKLDSERIDRVIYLRRCEQSHMQSYIEHTGCLMEFLLTALNDPEAAACGKCANCKGKGLPHTITQEALIEAENFLKNDVIIINPRHHFPAGFSPEQNRNIPTEYLIEQGRSLCYYGDAGWGRLVRDGKYKDDFFNNELVIAATHLICERWQPKPAPTWITSIPSTRHPQLVSDFSKRLSEKLNIPFFPVIYNVKENPEQKNMQNSCMQAHNVFDAIGINNQIPQKPVLLIDDIIDSGWTLTIAGYLLRENGCGPVFPFTLAQATGRSINT